jgi:hypothetical protein
LVPAIVQARECPPALPVLDWDILKDLDAMKWLFSDPIWT